MTDETFDAEVLGSREPVIVDFWAPWCKPCAAIEPHLRAIAAENAGRLRLVRMNIDENLGVPGRYGVLSLPTVILFAQGEVREIVYGTHPRSRYERLLAHLAA